LLAASYAAGGGAAVFDAAPASARGKSIAQELFNVKPNPNEGSRGFVFEKPAGFRQYGNPVDPSGYLFRNVNDTYFSFVTRSESRPNASIEFTPQAFIDDYKTKFTKSTGSEFKLIKGGGTPDRIDEGLGTKYYEVEYTVRTQLGFSFDSLKTLHFLTVFAATPDSMIIVNCQAPEEKWDEDGEILRKVVSSFAVTS